MIANPSKSRLSYLLTIYLPYWIKTSVLYKLFGKTVTTWIIQNIGNRLLSLFYLVMVLGSWSVIFFYTYPWIDEASAASSENSHTISQNHKYIGYVVFLACTISWYVASQSSPGVITSDNIEVYNVYPYDGLMFVEGRICPTTNILKLARSKYDRYTSQHISKFDHYCGWIQNPVGERNYRWFLLFLLIQVGMCLYGSYVLGYLLLVHEVQKYNLYGRTFFHRVTGEEFLATTQIVLQYLFHKYQLQSCVFLLLGIASLTLLPFLLWHCYIASCGTTTNESVKWKQVHKWYNIELQRYHENEYNNTKEDNSSNKNDGDDDYVMITKDNNDNTITAKDTAERMTNTTLVRDDAMEEENDDNDVTSKTIFHPGPKPKNIYNYGFIQNWKDIFYPRSIQKEKTLQQTKRESSSYNNNNKTKSS